MSIQKYITMLLYKLNKKDKEIKLVTIYSLYYDGRYEQFTNKKELFQRLLEIDKELQWVS